MGALPRRHVPAAFILSVEVKLLCSWCRAELTNPFAGDGEDNRFRYNADLDPGGYNTTVECWKCRKRVKVPKAAHIKTMLTVGGMPLWPSLLKNRTARGQLAGQTQPGFSDKKKRIGKKKGLFVMPRLPSNERTWRIVYSVRSTRVPSLSIIINCSEEPEPRFSFRIGFSDASLGDHGSPGVWTPEFVDYTAEGAKFPNRIDVAEAIMELLGEKDIFIDSYIKGAREKQAYAAKCRRKGNNRGT